MGKKDRHETDNDDAEFVFPLFHYGTWCMVCTMDGRPCRCRVYILLKGNIYINIYGNSVTVEMLVWNDDDDE